MKRLHFSRIIAAAVAALTAASTASAQLTEYVWDTTKTGPQLWQLNGNWAPSGFPNGPLHTANLNRPLGANLNANIGGGVTVAGITLGGSAAARTTEISGTGALTFRNDDPAAKADFNSNTIVEGQDFLTWQRNFALSAQTTNANGDADLSGTVDTLDYDIWKQEFGLGIIAAKGSPFINSLGTAGSVHTIHTNVALDNEALGINGNTNLTINGNLAYNGDPANSGISAAALRVNRSSLTVTLNGGLTMVDDMDPVATNDHLDFFINDTDRAGGRVIINGPISGAGDLVLGTASSNVDAQLSTIELNGNSTFNGSVRLRRGTFVLGTDNAFGFNPGALPDESDDTRATVRPDVGANMFGSNLVSTNDSRNIKNNIVLGGTIAVKGTNSLTLSGNITQTNNRQFINLLPAGKTLTLSGRIDIWEDDEPTVVRTFEIDGSGTTRITGTIHNDPQGTFEPRRLAKRGSGVLIMDMAAGSNVHTGEELVYQGNMHFTTNDSLGPTIRSYGGAVGVDTGVANNTTFMGAIHPESDGGLMLAASDANAALDFTTTLANAANMTVAAPETGMNFTGSINPANNRYQLGGGTGTLTLPNAQLTGAGNRLEVRNGGTVQLLGDNTYGGSTTILTKYTSTKELQAAADHPSNAESLLFSEVAPTLVVDKLANGGVASSIGSASSDAANLFIHGSTLKYVGAGDSTNRLFTIGTGGATIDSSGAGAVSFTNAGALGRDEAEDRQGTLDDFSRNPNVLYDFADTSDVMIGMTVNDPDPGVGGLGLGANLPNRIQTSATAAGVPSGLVTGISDDGSELGLNINLPFILKPNTRIVFGTVARTLTLAGSNAGANTLASAIANSDKGGVVNIAKTGAGTWVLSGANTYTGTTTVSQGTLIVNGAQSGGGATTVAAGATLGGDGTLGGNLAAAGTVDPGAVGATAGVLSVAGNAAFASGSTAVFEIGGTAANQFDQLNMTGTLAAGGSLSVSLIGGFVPAVGNSFDIMDFTTATGAFSLSLPNLGAGKAWNTSGLLSTGTISVAAAFTAVPEPATGVLVGLAAAALWRRRRA